MCKLPQGCFLVSLPLYFAPARPARQAPAARTALLVPASPATLPIRPKWLPETDSQPFGASCRYRRQPARQAAQRPSLTLTLRVVCGNEKAGAGGFVRHGFFVVAHDPHTAAVA